ncbi:MAG TPA: glycosyltransferase family 2 protein [Humisphaera sp.]|jgi:glycosyltransferase involved in cell wall biosynthesis|nr:glycosyltransferase family 2 protein [Humisphaera sp.]
MNIVCVCPVKDEAAHLERFLGAASQWATQIIIADQGSTDGSVEIAARYPKVRLIRNESVQYSEQERQKLLIDAAREVAAPRFIVALDADELLTANVLESDEWERAQRAAPGTAIFFDWINLLPGLKRGWTARTGLPWAYVDDGRAHVGAPIHSPRVPWGQSCAPLEMKEVKVLHYQFADWELMKRKQMWYQCWELVNTPQARACDIHRRYHHMDAVPQSTICDVRDDWFEAYERAGIAARAVRVQPTDTWDHRILDMLLTHGADRFRQLDIWSVDWRRRLVELRPAESGRARELADPRRVHDRLMLSWMRRAHRRSPMRRHDRAIRKLVRPLGW